MNNSCRKYPAMGRITIPTNLYSARENNNTGLRNAVSSNRTQNWPTVKTYNKYSYII